MDFQNRAGNKAGGGGVAGWSVKLFNNHNNLINLMNTIF